MGYQGEKKVEEGRKESKKEKVMLISFSDM